MRLLALLGVASLLAAGCTGPEETAGTSEPAPRYLHVDEIVLSESRFGSLPAEEVWIPASTDGTLLHAVVWRPDAPESWKAPVILIDTPYRTSDVRRDPLDAAEDMGLDSYDWLLDEMVPRGYAVVYKEVRGTGESGGCLEQTAPTQRQDGHDAVEFLAAQPWSSGKVGMFGKSYLAETQYGAAITQPPSLVTIVPIASVSGQYEWNLYDGVPFTAQTLTGNALYLAGSGVSPATTPQGIQNYPTHYPCQPAMMAQGADMTGDWNQYWDDRELRTHFPDIQASVLYVHGLQDWNVRQVAVRDAFDRIPSEKRLVLGQWHHDHPDGNTYRPDWSRTDWRTIVHAWYDHYLLGLDNGILQRLPPVQVQDSQGAWRAELAYPPADATPFTFHLGQDSLGAGPVPGLELKLRENAEGFLGLPSAPDGVPTELSFESAPLERALRFSGWPVLDLEFTLDAGTQEFPGGSDAHLAANLEMTGCGDAAWINAGYLSLRHREGLDKPAPVPLGKKDQYALRLSPADTVVPAGCALRLTLAGSDGVTQPQGSQWHGTITAGSLSFPAVERDLGVVGLDVPMARP